MSKVADLFKQHLEANDIKYTYYPAEGERREAIKVSYDSKVANSLTAFFIFDGDNTLSLKFYSIAKIPDEKLMDMYVLMNELNTQYRWAKFYVDADNEVAVEGDLIVDPNSVGEECEELMFKFMSIIEKAYPKIMKVLWS